MNSDSVNGYLNRFNDKVDNFILLKEQGKTALKGRETTLLEDGGLFLWYLFRASKKFFFSVAGLPKNKTFFVASLT